MATRGHDGAWQKLDELGCVRRSFRGPVLIGRACDACVRYVVTV